MEVRARLGSWLFRIATALALAGCVGPPDPIGSAEAELIVVSDCSVAGSGTIATGEIFSGDIHDDGGGAGPLGEWDHALGGEHFVGVPSSLTCRINGSTIAD